MATKNDRFVRQIEYKGWLVDVFEDGGRYSVEIDEDAPMRPMGEAYWFDSMGAAILAGLINVDYYQLADWSTVDFEQFQADWLAGEV